MQNQKISAILLASAGFLLLAWGLYSFMNPLIIISWSTATEMDTAGYYLYRSADSEGPLERITPELIPAGGDPLTGSDYEYIDSDVSIGETYFYTLEEIETSGGANREAPIQSTAAARGIPESLLGLAMIGLGVWAGLVYRRRAR